jgi:cell division transport system permease protein
VAKNHKIRKKRIPYLSTVLSISLVLFLLGLFGLVVIYANQLKTYVKENVQVSIFFKETAREPDIMRVQKRLDEHQFVKSTRYVSKDEAIKMITADLGEDPEKLLGFNPLPHSIEVFLNADYAVTDSIEPFVAELEKNNMVKEVYYQKILISNIQNIVQTVAVILLSFSILFLIIAITLISSLVRLTLFSKRFLIKSMQLVGATPGFIRKPFILKAISHGLAGSIVAVMLLSGILFLAHNHFPGFQVLHHLELIAGMFGLLLLLGILISWASSYFALNKYLKLKLDDLY